MRGAEIGGVEGAGRLVDLRIADGRIEAIEARLEPRADEGIVDAGGGALLPGLHDHHLHLRALAAAQASIVCGPPRVDSPEALVRALRDASAGLPAGEWLRGIGYHERVAGSIDRHWLDLHGPARPLRIQHRSGRCWIFNSAALRALGVDPERPGDDPLERLDGSATGRLFDADDWLRTRLPRRPPSLATVSARLARFGVTAVTDATPRNDAEEFRALAAAQRDGELLQDLVLMGSESLDHGIAGERPSVVGPRLSRGATKFHLHDAELPDFDATVRRIRHSHRAGRATAFHCVTRGELAFALAAIEAAGAIDGDRIEHASVTPPELLDGIAQLGLRVVAQPNFVGERGDAYLDEVDADDRPWLYRLRSFIDRGVALYGSTDAPFGDADPWAAMRAAVSRRAPDGRVVGLGEALTPEQALGLFSGRSSRGLRVGARADLCLLDRPWSAARGRLQSGDLRRVLRAGQVIWDRDPST